MKKTEEQRALCGWQTKHDIMSLRKLREAQLMFFQALRSAVCLLEGRKWELDKRMKTEIIFKYH